MLAGKINIAITGYYQKQYINNFLFDNNNDNNTNELAFKKYQELRVNAYKQNISINTLDLFVNYKPDCILIVEYPGKTKITQLLKLNVPLILIMEECEVVNNLSLSKINFENFYKVLTFDDDLILKETKFLKFNTYSYIENTKITKNFESKKLLCLIASNKKSSHHNELYSERLKIIEWYEKNNPDNFNLYGQNWNKYVFSLNNNSLRFLNSRKFKYLQYLFSSKRCSWKGTVKKKSKVLNQYKFNIAFENAKNIKGYICEKIFDSFAASSVPIYYGAPNILSYIPKNSFIDYRDFKTIKNLNLFLESMSQNEYFDYLENIEYYLKSEEVYQFTSDYFSESILNLVNDMFTK